MLSRRSYTKEQKNVILAVICFLCIGGTAILLAGWLSGNTNRGVETLTAASRPVTELMEPPRLETHTEAASQEDREQAWIRADQEFHTWKQFSAPSGERMQQAATQKAALENKTAFYAAVVPAMLSAQETDDPVCSPLSAYWASLVLAEAAPDKAVLSDALCLRYSGDHTFQMQGADALWRSNYVDSQMTRCGLETSLWLGHDTGMEQELLSALSESYHIDVFRTKKGADIRSDVQAWLLEHSGSAPEDIPAEALREGSLVSTVRLNVRFQKQAGTQVDGVFHGANGDKPCTFDRSESLYAEYFSREKFRAACLELELLTSSGKLWFILPEEGVSPEELLREEELYGVFGGEQGQIVHRTLTMPSFRSAALFDATGALESQVFRNGWGGQTAAYLQALDLEVDPFGCNAPDAGTLVYSEAALEAPEVDFVLDRPFLYAVTSSEGDILFFGIIHQV